MVVGRSFGSAGILYRPWEHVYIARGPEETKMATCNVVVALCLAITLACVVESGNISPECLEFIQYLICKFENNGLKH